MSKTLYEIYQSETFTLAKTMVVHHPLTAQAINKELEIRGYRVDWDRPETWKYYMNLAGEYHESDIDTILSINNNESPYMRIKIAGNNEPVPADFVKDLVSGSNADIALANEYRFGGTFYNSLVKKYPSFESLILGILNPIDKQLAINSYNGDILYMGSYYRTKSPYGTNRFSFEKKNNEGIVRQALVEDHEINLIPNVEKWIKNFFLQWDNKDYARYNDLYPAALLGVMFAFIPAVIMNERLRACKTAEVHTYHVKEYLNSHGDLGQYVNYLSREQLMFLYRNMLYLEANMGKTLTFDLLVTNLLTKMGIPLAGYRLKHNTNELNFGDYTAEPYMYREAINLKSVGTGSDRRTIRSIVLKSDQLARDNYIDHDGQIALITERSEVGPDNNLSTKVLESDMVDWSDRYIITKAEVLLNAWLYSIEYGNYRGSIYATHPLNGERIQLTPRTAFILFWYTYNVGYAGITFEEMPMLKARNIPRSLTKPYESLPDYPTLRDLKHAISTEDISDKQLNKLLNGEKPTFSFSSSVDFNAKVLKQHALLIDRLFTALRYETFKANGQFEYAVSKMYWLEVEIPPLINVPFSQWLNNHGFDFTGMQRADYRRLADEILVQGTGSGESSSGWLQNMQRAAIEIMKHFSSYSVHYIRNITNGSTTLAGLKSLRVDNIRSRQRSLSRVNITSMRKLDPKAFASSIVPIGYNDRHLTNIRVGKASAKVKAQITPSINITSRGFKQYQRINIANVRVSNVRFTEHVIPRDFRYMVANPIADVINGLAEMAFSLGATGVELSTPVNLRNMVSERVPMKAAAKSAFGSNTSSVNVDYGTVANIRTMISNPVTLTALGMTTYAVHTTDVELSLPIELTKRYMTSIPLSRLVKGMVDTTVTVETNSVELSQNVYTKRYISTPQVPFTVGLGNGHIDISVMDARLAISVPYSLRYMSTTIISE